MTSIGSGNRPLRQGGASCTGKERQADLAVLQKIETVVAGKGPPPDLRGLQWDRAALYPNQLRHCQPRWLNVSRSLLSLQFPRTSVR